LTISAGAFSSDKATTTTTTTKAGANGTQFQVMYKQGKLDLGAAMTSKDDASVAAEGGTYKSQTIGASYDLGVAKLMAVRTVDKFKSSVALVAENDYKRTVNQVGLRAPFGKTTLVASYATGEHEIGATPTPRDLKGLILAADYAFSKRTSAYVSYGKAESEASATFTGVDKQTSIGLRHSF
jgi:predicted porin